MDGVNIKKVVTLEDLAETVSGLAGVVTNLSGTVANLSVAVTDLSETVTKGFEKTEQRFEQIDQRFEQVDERFNKIDKKFERVDVRLASLEDKAEKNLLNNAEGFNGMHEEFVKIYERAAEISQEILGLRNSVNNYLRVSDDRYLEIKRRQDILVKWISQVADKAGVKLNLSELNYSDIS